MCRSRCVTRGVQYSGDDMALTLTLQGTATAPTGFGSLSVGPISFVGTIAPQVVNLNLVSGNNSVTVPTGAVGCVVTPPASSAIVIKYKTTSGDVGVNVPQATPSVFVFDSSNVPATVYLNAASNTTGQTQVVFF